MAQPTIKAGDERDINLKVKSGDTLVTPDVAETVEVMVGEYTHLYPDTLSFNDDLKCYVVHITQAESFSMESQTVPIDVRVKLNNTKVLGTQRITYLVVTEAISTREL